MKTEVMVFQQESFSFEANACQVAAILLWFVGSIYYEAYWLTFTIGVTAMPATIACIVGEVKFALARK